MMDPRTECDCPTDHTVAKLGHCRTCPWHRALPVTVIADSEHPPDSFTLFVCGPRRCPATGAEHDFEWATYSDDLESYGVCRCGYDYRSKMMWEGP